MIDMKNKMVPRAVFPVLFILLLLFSAPKGFSQDTIRYSLDDVIAIARSQSPDALIAKHRFRSSYWSYRSFKADYLPSLGMSAQIPNIQRMFGNETYGGVTNSVFTNTSSYQVDLSIQQKIGFTGGVVSIGSRLERLDNLVVDDSSRVQYTASLVNISLVQPIFAYNPYKWDKQIKPLEYEASKRAYIETNEQVAMTSIDYFFSLLLAQIQVGIAEKNYSNYDTLFRIATGRYTLGKIAENELLQLELNLLKAEASVEDAELNYQKRLFIFKSYLRLKDGSHIELVPPAETFHFDVLSQKAIQEAKDNTSPGLEFKKRLLEAESELNYAKMNGRFDANLFASFGLTQSAFDIQSTYQNPRDAENIRLGINIPILDWGVARGRIKMAESNQALVQTAVEQDKIDFEHNIFLNVMEFNMQKKQLTIAAKSDTVAQKRYMIGKVNDVLELKNAQIDNDNAKMGYYRSLMTYWKSYYELRKLTLYDFRRGMPIQVSIDELID